MLQQYNYQYLEWLNNLSVITIYHTQYAVDLMAAAEIAGCSDWYIEQWWSCLSSTRESLATAQADGKKITDEMSRRRSLVGFM